MDTPENPKAVNTVKAGSVQKKRNKGNTTRGSKTVRGEESKGPQIGLRGTVTLKIEQLQTEMKSMGELLLFCL